MTAPAPEPLVATVLRRASEEPTRVAMRKKHLGRWRTYTWGEVGERVSAAASGLSALGVQPGATVAVLADNRPAWVLADLAAQALGATTLGLDPDLEAAEVGALLAASAATVLVAEDEEQVDKVLLAEGAARRLAHVVVVDPRGVDVGGARLLAWADVEARGRGVPVDPTAVPPSDAVLELARAADEAAEAFGLDGRTELLSHVSLSQAAERVVSMAAVVRHGCVVSFPESPSSFPRDLHDVAPTFLLGGPHLWSGLRGEVESRMATAGAAKGAAYRWAVRGGPGGLRSLLVHRPLRRRLGLDRVAAAASTGAVSPEDAAWVRAIGVPLREEVFQPALARGAEVRR